MGSLSAYDVAATINAKKKLFIKFTTFSLIIKFYIAVA